MNKLTVKEVRSTTKVGRLSDGGGLYLRVRKNGSKAWVFMNRKNSKVTELGLGAANDISLVKAREMAQKLRERSLAGLPLIEVVVEKEVVPTFLQVAELVLKSKEKPLHHLQVTDIKTPHVLRILEPMWLTKHETASRLRGRIEAVMDYAKAMGWRTGENPALWRGNLNMLLPAYSKSQNIKHHPALEVEVLPSFIKELRSREATVARLLEFIILTAARSGEARFATWDEIDFDKRLWTISAERMKMSKSHQVPLSRGAFGVLTELFGSRRSELIFQHPLNAREFSVNATRALLQRMSYARITTHGFRSTFRDWAGDMTTHQRETIEAALAHRIKDRAEAAYRRSTAIEKRRALMQNWDDYCSNVVIHAGA